MGILSPQFLILAMYLIIRRTKENHVLISDASSIESALEGEGIASNFRVWREMAFESLKINEFFFFSVPIFASTIGF